MTNLTALHLYSNKIRDLTPLAGLTNLTALHLYSNKIRDLTPLAGLTNLTALHLGSNEIRDFTLLAGLTNLTTLSLGDNEIRDLTLLAGLTNLTTLSLGDNEIRDLTPLAGLTNLTALHLYSNKIRDLTPLAGLTNLTTLSLGDNEIRDLTLLAGLTNLTTLDLGDNEIRDLTPLAGLTNLTALYLHSNEIRDFTPLAGLTNLTTLRLDSNGIRDLTPLAGLTNLTTLRLDSNGIRDLAPLAGLTNLTTLDLNSNEIRDLAPLAGLTNLTTLDLNSNEIRDLTPLAGLTSLTTLNLSLTLATDLSPLFGLTKLASLDIDYAPVPQEDLATLAEAGVAIDGSPLLMGAVDIHHDNVIVMHLPELPAMRGFDTLAYTRRLYEEFEDAFDYVLFVYNFDERPEDLPSGWYISVRNDTQGIGKRIFSYPDYGKQLLGVTVLSYRSAIQWGPSLHELMHCWANFVIPTSSWSHWGFSSAYGQLGGFRLDDLVHLGGDRYKVLSFFGTFANGGNSVPYSPVELYLAGLIPPDEVPDLWVAGDGEWLVENGERVWSDDDQPRPIFTAPTARTMTIEDIIAEHGERIPDWTVSQKDFQAAAVLLVDDDHPATPEQIQEVSDHVSWFSHPGNDYSYLYNYYEATGGRAFITMDGLSQFLLPDQ